MHSNGLARSCVLPGRKRSIESFLCRLPHEPSHLFLVASKVFADLFGGVDVRWRIRVGDVSGEQADNRDELQDEREQCESENQSQIRVAKGNERVELFFSLSFRRCCGRWR